LIAVVDRLRSAPIALDVIATATSADYQNFAGIRLALRQLSLEQRGRLQAILVIGPLLSESLVVETQTDQAAPSGTGRLAARLHDALGIETSPRVAGDLFRAIQLTQVAASPMSFSATGTDAEPSEEAIAKGARAVLVALAYVPTHLSEMH
jgi:hypothetical protein